MSEKGKIFYDQMGREVALAGLPKRIISIVPSQTELLYALGIGEVVVGITKFCIHPEQWYHSKMRVGGTKMLDMAKIAALQPDLIIGNKEENKQEQIEELMRLYPVWISDIHNLDDALEMIKRVGALVGKDENAQALVILIRRNFAAMGCPSRRRRACYFIWRNPFMTVGNDTFISSMMERCNFENVFADLPDRYPVVTVAQISSAKPEIILLSSEPFPFAEKHIAGFQKICPYAKIMLVDGEYFSWYGSRLAGAPEYLRKVVNEVERDMLFDTNS